MEASNALGVTKLQDVDLDASQRAGEIDDPVTASRSVDCTFNNEGGNNNGNLEAGDFSERTHDQLPSVEAYKATTEAYTDMGGKKSKRFQFLLVGIILFVFMIVFISMGVVLGNSKGKEDAKAPAASTSAAAHQTNHSSGTTPAGSPHAGSGSRLEAVVEFVSVTHPWSNAKDLVNPTSPQHKAALWIADNDRNQYPIEDDVSFKSRYALAVFYYAMKGPKWVKELSWMTQAHACKWSEQWSSVVGPPITVGVVCEQHTNNVTAIFLPSNNLVGTVPPEIQLLTSLRELDLYKNDVHGSISEHFKSLTSLRTLVLHDNSLTGKIPSWLSTLPKLKMIDFAMNQLNGYIPHTLKELQELETLNLDHNRLIGKVDPLQGLPAIKNLILSNNMFTGHVSDGLLAGWPMLKLIDLSDNNIIGVLPTSLLQNPSLEIADFHGNQIDGHLPKVSKGVDSPLVFLAVHDNKLTGEISSELGHLTNLRHLDLSNNQFEGTLPESLGVLTHLKYLFVAHNSKLDQGSIPIAWSSLHNLEDLSLQGTNRIGRIPTEIGLMKSLVLLDLAENKLDHFIPNELGSLHKLVFLILKNNQLTGSIPTTFRSMPALDTIVIDRNELTGGQANICTRNQTRLRAFIADCGEIDCECCTGCCLDTNVTCNNSSWFSQHDPLVNYEYKRVHYKFPNIIYPLPDSVNASKYYETFGMPGIMREPGGGVRYRQ